MKLSEYRKKLAKKNPDVVRKVKRDIGFKVGMVITGIRIRKGLTQEALAKKTGLKQESISRAEQGYHCSTQVLQKIADALDIVIKIHL